MIMCVRCIWCISLVRQICGMYSSVNVQYIFFFGFHISFILFYVISFSFITYCFIYYVSQLFYMLCKF